MELQLTIRHGTVPPAVREAVERKLARLGKRLPNEALVEARLDRGRGSGGADDHSIDAEIHLKGGNVVGRARGSTYENAADRVVEVLERQIEKRRDKRVHEPRRRTTETSGT